MTEVRMASLAIEEVVDLIEDGGHKLLSSLRRLVVKQFDLLGSEATPSYGIIEGIAYLTLRTQNVGMLEPPSEGYITISGQNDDFDLGIEKVIDSMSPF